MAEITQLPKVSTEVDTETGMKVMRLMEMPWTITTMCRTSTAACR